MKNQTILKLIGRTDILKAPASKESFSIKSDDGKVDDLEGKPN